MSKRSERLQKAAWLTDMLEDTPIDVDQISESETELAMLWDHIVGWLASHSEWLPDGIKPINRKWTFLSAISWLKNQPGGRFLNFRVLRASEKLLRNPRQEDSGEFLGARYVLSDGSRDMAEIVVDLDTNEIQWIMVYQSQNLSHLIQEATRHNVRIVD